MDNTLAVSCLLEALSLKYLSIIQLIIEIASENKGGDTQLIILFKQNDLTQRLNISTQTYIVDYENCVVNFSLHQNNLKKNRKDSS